MVQGLGPMLHTGFTDLATVNDFREVLQYDKAKLGKFIAGLHDRWHSCYWSRALVYFSSPYQRRHSKALDIADEVFKLL